MKLLTLKYHAVHLVQIVHTFPWQRRKPCFHLFRLLLVCWATIANAPYGYWVFTCKTEIIDPWYENTDFWSCIEFGTYFQTFKSLQETVKTIVVEYKFGCKGISALKAALEYCKDLARSCQNLNSYWSVQTEPFYWLRSHCS